MEKNKIFKHKKLLFAALIASMFVNILFISYMVVRTDLSDLYDKVLYYREIPVDEFQSPKIPEIYNHDILQLSFVKNVKTKSDFEPWRDQVVIKTRELLNIPPDEEINNQLPTKIYFQDHKSYTITKYSMLALDDDEILFYEVLPDRMGEKVPAVLIIPASGNMGAKDVLGIPSDLTKYYREKDIGVKIVNQGYAVYVIENRGWGERSIDVGTECNLTTKSGKLSCSGILLDVNLNNLGYHLGGLQTTDTIQLLKLIQSRNYVDNENITIMSLSLGGGVSFIVSALYPEIKSTIVASGITNLNKTRPFGSGTFGILKYFDTTDIAATIAPRPLYLSWGYQEGGPFGFDARTHYAYNQIKKSYELFDAENNIVAISHSGGHTYDVPSVLDFLNKTLEK